MIEAQIEENAHKAHKHTRT